MKSACIRLRIVDVARSHVLASNHNFTNVIRRKRNAILEQIRRGRVAQTRAAAPVRREETPGDFVEQQGGIY